MPEMRVPIRALFAVVVVASVLGCSAFTPTISNEPGIVPIAGVERYRAVEIAPVESAPWVDVKAGDRAKIRASFVDKLSASGLRVSVADSVGESEGVMVLASLIDYNERRVNDSRGRMRIHVALIDKASGDTLSQADLRSKTIKGWLSHPDDRRTGQAIGARLIEYCKSVGLGTK